jgi:hypothetical protein
MKLLIAILAAILMIAASPSPVRGQAINLSWNDCGASGVELRTFACDTNVGVHTLVGSFVPGPSVDSMTAAQAVVDVQTLGPSIPDWWGMRTGYCRPASLNASFDFTGGPFNCHDYWQGGAVGGVAADAPAGNRVRIRVAMALPQGDSRVVDLDDDTEVYAFKVNINSAKSTGDGACAGCDVGACIAITNIQVGTITDGQPLTFFLFAPATRIHVTWQCPGFVSTVGCMLDCTTPTRNRTWGQVKQLYR